MNDSQVLHTLTPNAPKRQPTTEFDRRNQMYRGA